MQQPFPELSCCLLVCALFGGGAWVQDNYMDEGVPHLRSQTYETLSLLLPQGMRGV